MSPRTERAVKSTLTPHVHLYAKYITAVHFVQGIHYGDRTVKTSADTFTAYRQSKSLKDLKFTRHILNRVIKMTCYSYQI